jgi:hypothetical protein
LIFYCQVKSLDVAFEKMIESTKQDIEEKAQHNYELDRQVLELLVFLWHWLFESMESRIKKENKTKKGDEVWDTTKKQSNRLLALNLVHKFLLLQLDAIFISSADLDLIINEYFCTDKLGFQIHPHMSRKSRNSKEWCGERIDFGYYISLRI